MRRREDDLSALTLRPLEGDFRKELGFVTLGVALLLGRVLVQLCHNILHIWFLLCSVRCTRRQHRAAARKACGTDDSSPARRRWYPERGRAHCQERDCGCHGTAKWRQHDTIVVGVLSVLSGARDLAVAVISSKCRKHTARSDRFVVVSSMSVNTLLTPPD
jgi:hypothetical protein